LHELRIAVLCEQLRAHARQRRKTATPATAAAQRPAMQERVAPDPSGQVTIVSGLPRTGTSMMMQMLAAGGITPYTDDGRPPDFDNPRGYFEHDLATRLASNVRWLPEVRGKVVKIVAPLLSRLPDTETYAIVMMHRDLSEVVASQREMLRRLERKGTSLKDVDLMDALRREMQRVEQWIANNGHARVLHLDYAEVLADPPAASRKLAGFLGRPLDLAAMEQAVLPRLRRQSRSA